MALIAQVIDSPTNDLLAGGTDHVGEARVALDDAKVATVDNDADWRLFEYGTKIRGVVVCQHARHSTLVAGRSKLADRLVFTLSKCGSRSHACGVEANRAERHRHQRAGPRPLVNTLFALLRDAGRPCRRDRALFQGWSRGGRALRVATVRTIHGKGRGGRPVE